MSSEKIVKAIFEKDMVEVEKLVSEELATRSIEKVDEMRQEVLSSTLNLSVVESDKDDHVEDEDDKDEEGDKESGED